MLALEATFVTENATGLEATYELRLGEERFSADIRSGTITIVRGTARAPDVIIETDAETLRTVAFGDRKSSAARVDIRGDEALARKFFRLFARPSSTRKT
jgi:hypothetical protein